MVIAEERFALNGGFGDVGRVGRVRHVGHFSLEIRLEVYHLVGQVRQVGLN